MAHAIADNVAFVLYGGHTHNRFVLRIVVAVGTCYVFIVEAMFINKILWGSLVSSSIAARGPNHMLVGRVYCPREYGGYCNANYCWL